MNKKSLSFNSKLAQASLEFIVLFVFALVLTSLALYFMGFFALGFSEREANLHREDIANLILEEFYISSEVYGGYKRNVTIPAFILANYNITLNQSSSLMIIKDYVVDKGEIQYFYDLPFGSNFTTFLDSNGDLMIEIYKRHEEDLEGVLLI